MKKRDVEDAESVQKGKKAGGKHKRQPSHEDDFVEEEGRSPGKKPAGSKHKPNQPKKNQAKGKKAPAKVNWEDADDFIESARGSFYPDQTRRANKFRISCFITTNLHFR